MVLTPVGPIAEAIEEEDELGVDQIILWLRFYTKFDVTSA